MTQNETSIIRTIIIENTIRYEGGTWLIMRLDNLVGVIHSHVTHLLEQQREACAKLAEGGAFSCRAGWNPQYPNDPCNNCCTSGCCHEATAYHIRNTPIIPLE